jgi:hypothetical protein
MPRRLDDLDDVHPLHDVGCTEDAHTFLLQVGEMLDDDTYAFAHDFLASVRLTVEDRGVVTPRQAQAVNNIREGAIRHGEQRSDRFSRRRYEGYRRG